MFDIYCIVRFSIYANDIFRTDNKPGTFDIRFYFYFNSCSYWYTEKRPTVVVFNT